MIVQSYKIETISSLASSRKRKEIALFSIVLRPCYYVVVMSGPKTNRKPKRNCFHVTTIDWFFLFFLFIFFPLFFSFSFLQMPILNSHLSSGATHYGLLLSCLLKSLIETSILLYMPLSWISLLVLSGLVIWSSTSSKGSAK